MASRGAAFGGNREELDSIGSGRWPAFELEAALVAFQVQPGGSTYTMIEELLGDALANKSQVPPFSVELLRHCDQTLARQPYVHDISRLRGLVGECLSKVSPYAFLVRTAVASLTRPFGGGDRSSLEDIASLVISRWSGAPLAPVGIATECMETSSLSSDNDWRNRLTMPFQRSDGRWRSFAEQNPPERDDIANEISMFWERFDRIVDGISGFRPVRGLIHDQLRRALCWHILVAGPQSNSTSEAIQYVGLAVPVFPSICVGEAGRVIVLGAPTVSVATPLPSLQPGLSISTDFAEATQVALGLATATWTNGNTANTNPGRGKWVHGGLRKADVMRTSLVLDFTLAAESLKILRWPLEIDGSSGGVTIAVGVCGLLSRQQVNAGAWATGVLFGSLESRTGTPYSTKRARSEGNAHIGWRQAHETNGRPTYQEIQALASKVLVARGHSVGFHVVVPVDLRTEIRLAVEDTIRRFDDRDTISRFGSSLGFHPISAPTLVAAQRALYSRHSDKDRRIGQIDLVTPGLFKALPIGSALEFRRFADLIASKKLAILCGDTLTGKTFAIDHFLQQAAERLKAERLTSPRVTRIQLPRAFLCPSQSWRCILNHLDFSTQGIEKFLSQPSPELAAVEFLQELRVVGPDILVISGLEVELERESVSQRLATEHFTFCEFFEALAATQNTIGRVPNRSDSLRYALSDLEIILEISSLGQLPSGLAECVVPYPQFRAPQHSPWPAMAIFSSVGCPLGAYEALESLSALRHQFSTAEIYALEQPHYGRTAWHASVLECLTVARLWFHDDEWLICSASPDSSWIDTGPLLRSCAGLFSVNPWLRASAPTITYDHKTSKFLLTVCQICCPATSFRAQGILPHETLSPERLLITVAYLSLLGNSPHARAAGEALATLLIHYFEPSVGVAACLARLRTRYHGPHEALLSDAFVYRVGLQSIRALGGIDNAPTSALVGVALLGEKLVDSKSIQCQRVLIQHALEANSAASTSLRDAHLRFRNLILVASMWLAIPEAQRSNMPNPGLLLGQIAASDTRAHAAGASRLWPASFVRHILRVADWLGILGYARAASDLWLVAAWSVHETWDFAHRLRKENLKLLNNSRHLSDGSVPLPELPPKHQKNSETTI